MHHTFSTGAPGIWSFPCYSSLRFLGYAISQDLKWESNVNTIIKKAQQRMFIESVACTFISVSFGSANKQDQQRVQLIIRAAERIIGTNLPNIQSGSRQRITADPPHQLPAPCLWQVVHCEPKKQSTKSVFPDGFSFSTTVPYSRLSDSCYSQLLPLHISLFLLLSFAPLLRVPHPGLTNVFITGSHCK